MKTIESNLLKDTQNEPVSFFFWHPLRFDGVCALSFSNGEFPKFLRLAFTLATWVCSFSQGVYNLWAQFMVEVSTCFHYYGNTW